MEEAETLKAAIDSGRYDYATLATQIGKSETYIRTRIKLTTLIPEIARLIDTEEITVAVATEISRYGVDIADRCLQLPPSKDGVPTIIGVV